MRIISAAEVETALDYASLIERLRQAFRRDFEVPVRHHHDVETGGASTATLLLMPAWQVDRHIGIKMVTIFPDNGEKSLPAVMGIYVLLDGKTGSPLALIDGPTLTVRRTAAASALASSYLSRPDSERLLMIGTGAMSPQLIMAHAAVRPICNVLIWGRDFDKADKLAKRLNRRDFRVEATNDLEAAVGGAHVISCATLSHQPLVCGDWLQPGQHVDLVGAFRPDMRESDDRAVERARVFVDTRAGGMSEAGDILQAIEAGVLSEEDIAGDLFELTRGERSGRRYYDQITLFKSVGTAIEDLAAAQLVYERR
ncbi:ornithine cyclodeaminase family protein [Pelagibius litoralis]|uniref:Ornithine cyclodeaminase family protein n=1 Tax=Pelagibius litoralis TaxID=374515 RepID=A0A967EV49_9PROT|nr:ornithine cyclodeaminase family protein [Pelagibius litoralis]NIA67982.1 ornithine cyclodeaminase family protein [Pelagibius litoralis]